MEPSGEPPKQLNVGGCLSSSVARTRSLDSFAIGTATPGQWIMACIRFVRR